MTREYTSSESFKVSADKNTLKDWNNELRILWLEFGHEADIKQVENWRSDK